MPVRTGKKPRPYHKHVTMEALIPALIAEKLPVTEFAERAGVHCQTASRFLKEKAEEFATINTRQFFRINPQHAAAFNKAAERQMEWIAELNDKPRHTWTEADFRLEKHVISTLKSLAPFLEIAARALATAPPLRENPHTSEGENPQDETPAAPATLGDGL